MPGAAVISRAFRLFATGKGILLSTAAIVTVSLVGAAATTLYFSNRSTVQTASAPPPVVFSAGSDAGQGTYVRDWALSANGTSFAVTLRGVPEMSLVVGELFRVTNQDTVARTLVVSAPRAESAHVTAYTIQFLDGAALVGTLNLKDAAPSVTLPSIPPGKTYSARVTLTLASGAGNHNAAAPSTLSLDVL